MNEVIFLLPFPSQKKKVNQAFDSKVLCLFLCIRNGIGSAKALGTTALHNITLLIKFSVLVHIISQKSNIGRRHLNVFHGQHRPALQNINSYVMTDLKRKKVGFHI